MFDKNRLDVLYQDIGPDLMQDLLDLFAQEGAEAILALKTAQRPDQVKQAAHFLRGNCSNLGLEALTHACANLERSGTKALPSPSDIKALEVLFYQSLDALKANLDMAGQSAAPQ